MCKQGDEIFGNFLRPTLKIFCGMKKKLLTLQPVWACCVRLCKAIGLQKDAVARPTNQIHFKKSFK